MKKINLIAPLLGVLLMGTQEASGKIRHRLTAERNVAGLYPPYRCVDGDLYRSPSGKTYCVKYDLPVAGGTGTLAQPVAGGDLTGTLATPVEGSAATSTALAIPPMQTNDPANCVVGQMWRKPDGSVWLCVGPSAAMRAQRPPPLSVYRWDNSTTKQVIVEHNTIFAGQAVTLPPSLGWRGYVSLVMWPLSGGLFGFGWRRWLEQRAAKRSEEREMLLLPPKIYAVGDWMVDS